MENVSLNLSSVLHALIVAVGAPILASSWTLLSTVCPTENLVQESCRVLQFTIVPELIELI